MIRVVSAKNGSIVAVTGSGIRHMSDSLIAFQPAIDEPSNIKPSAKASSSIMPTSKVTCCHLPRGSVNRRSTYLAVFMNTPFGLQVIWPRAATLGNAHYNWGKLNTISEYRHRSIGGTGSDGIQSGFPGSDTNGFLDVGHEDLAVADAPGLGRAPDGVDCPFNQIIRDHNLDLNLG